MTNNICCSCHLPVRDGDEWFLDNQLYCGSCMALEDPEFVAECEAAEEEDK